MAQPVVPTGLASARRVRLVLDVEERPGHFLLDEDDVPETPLHDHIIDLLKPRLGAWAQRSDRDVLLASNGDAGARARVGAGRAGSASGRGRAAASGGSRSRGGRARRQLAVLRGEG